MSPRYPSADPRLVREALAYAETHTCNATAVHFGINHHTVKRWKAYRADRSPRWPTDQDIALWDSRAEIRANMRRIRRRHDLRKIRNDGQPILVPQHGTIRRLQALCALGWTQAEIGRRLGVSRARISDLIRVTRQGVLPETAAKVATLYSELSMIVPVGARSGMVRAAAKRKGWAPPLAWDDDLLDDPAARPEGTGSSSGARIIDEAAIERRLAGDRRVRLHKGEAAEVVRRLLAAGVTTHVINVDYGIKAERYIKLGDRQQVAA